MDSDNMFTSMSVAWVFTERAQEITLDIQVFADPS